MSTTLRFEDAALALAARLGDDDASRLAAGALIEAELLGQPRFGLDMLEEYVPARAVNARADDPGPTVVWRNCRGQFAPVAVADAVLSLVPRARAHGMAATFLGGVRGFGRLAPFVRHLADRGLVGFAGAEGPPFVAPAGGDKPVIGTNPFAFAVGQGAARVVIDAATSLATMAEVKTARATGRPLPEGVAIDADGEPTTSAADVAALLPRGGRLGSLVGLLVELLAGVVGQGRGDPAGRGVFFIAIDPQAADEKDAWREKLAALKADWTDGGGYWPSGRAPEPGMPLAPSVAVRLDAALERLDRWKEPLG